MRNNIKMTISLLCIAVIFLSCNKQTDPLEKHQLVKKYVVIDVDTIINFHSSGKRENGTYKQWTIKRIEANIILDDFPSKYDTKIFNTEMQNIVKLEGFTSAYVFRDVISKIAFRMSSMKADSIIKSRDGYLGRFTIK